MLIHNPSGNFSFIAGIGPFSFGCVADKGYEVLHVTLKPLLALWPGLDAIERYLNGLGRPLNALCGLELRIPEPLSAEGFNRFNQPYQEKLARWKLYLNGRNPVARTNVADAAAPVKEPSVFGFSYTVVTSNSETTFVLAGAPEVRRSESGESQIVALGDTSRHAMSQKAEFVMQVVGARLKEMDVRWSDATHVGVYTVHDIHPLIESTIAPAINGASRYGVCWYYARPPVVDFDFELDARGVRREEFLKP
jgi:hypothetical protein